MPIFMSLSACQNSIALAHSSSFSIAISKQHRQDRQTGLDGQTEKSILMYILWMGGSFNESYCFPSYQIIFFKLDQNQPQVMFRQFATDTKS